MTDVVFLGPSLSADEARAIAPHVLVLPPAALGDVISTVTRHRPHAIALVDGSFLQNMAVFHKELIDAMARGVWVIGASSMGALRAAECAPYGMIPVGTIADDFLVGRIVDDDEVALVHADEDDGFRALSDAMVEVRATLAAATHAGILRRRDEATLVELQKRRWFPERSLAAAVADARDVLGLPAHRVAELRTFVREQRVDIKANDARLALRALCELPAGPMPEADRPVLVQSGVYRMLRSRDQIVDAGGAPGDRPVRREDIRTHLALTDPDYAALWREAKQRTALVHLSHYLELEVDDADIGAARTRVTAALGATIDDLEDVARSLDMDTDELERMIEEDARVALLERWVANAMRGVGVEHAFHDVLRLRGRYRSARTSAALVEEMAARSEEHSVELPLRLAFAHHSMMSGLTLHAYGDDVDTFIEEAGLDSRPKLYDRLMTHVVAQRELLGIPAGAGLPDATDADHSDHALSSMNARGAR